MRKNIILYVAILFTTTILAQSNFTKGFEKGYKKGYCQDQGNCIEPISPVAPVPNTYESSGNYTDGYNRGFQIGLNARKSSSSNNSAVDKKRYKTAKPKYVDNIIYQAPINEMQKALKKLDNQHESNLQYGDFLKLKIQLLKKYSNDPLIIKGLNELTESISSVIEPRGVNVAEFLLKRYEININELEKFITLSKNKDYNIDNNTNKVYGIKAKTLIRTGPGENYARMINKKATRTFKKNIYESVSCGYKVKIKSEKDGWSKVERTHEDGAYLNLTGWIKTEYILRKKAKIKKQEKNNNELFTEIQNHFQKKEFDKVIEKLKSIETKIKQGTITDKKTLFFTYSILAYSHYNKSNLAKTIKYTTQAIDNSITNEIGDFYFLRGLSKSNIKDYYGANNDYDYLIKNYKKINYNSNNLATLYNNKGYNLILLKKYKEAKPLVNKAISLDKETDYIWGTKGELEYYLGNYSDAVNAMSKSIKIKPTANSYYFRGLAKIELGNKEKGCSDLSKSGEMGETKAYTEIKNRCN